MHAGFMWTLCHRSNTLDTNHLHKISLHLGHPFTFTELPHLLNTPPLSLLFDNVSHVRSLRFFVLQITPFCQFLSCPFVRVFQLKTNTPYVLSNSPLYLILGLPQPFSPTIKTQYSNITNEKYICILITHPHVVFNYHWHFVVGG